MVFMTMINCSFTRFLMMGVFSHICSGVRGGCGSFLKVSGSGGRLWSFFGWGGFLLHILYIYINILYIYLYIIHIYYHILYIYFNICINICIDVLYLQYYMFWG